MTVDEFRQRILELLRRAPFKPFEIEKTDGTVLHVITPRMVATNGGAGVYAAPDGEIVFFDWQDTRQLGSKASGAPA